MESTIRGDELIVSVHLPSAPGLCSTYLKAMDRKVWAFALVSVAASIRVAEGCISDASLVLGGVAPVPWRAEAAERILSGAEMSDELVTRAADAALEGAQPLAHNGYKVPLAKALIRRALISLTAQGSPPE
jgi:xanthine dehydrogenase YagS FAD-binding subunit